MRNNLFSLIGLSTILLLFSVSCSKTTDPGDDNGTTVTIPSKTISGKLMHKKYDALTRTYSMLPWDLGATKIKFSYSVSETIVTADVAADGSFTANLPTTLDAGKFFSSSLDLQITPTPSTLKKTIVPIIITVDYTEAGVALEGEVKFQSYTDATLLTPKTFYAIYCFDRDGSIKGTNSFSGDSYDLDATKGWNFMIWGQPTDSKISFSLTTTIASDVYFFL